MILKVQLKLILKVHGIFSIDGQVCYFGAALTVMTTVWLSGRPIYY